MTFFIFIVRKEMSDLIFSVPIKHLSKARLPAAVREMGPSCSKTG